MALRAVEWRKKNPQAVAEWKKENLLKVRRAVAEWRKKNPQRKKQLDAKWRRRNRGKINQYFCRRYHDDPLFKIARLLRKACGRAFKGIAKPEKTLELLGMELEEFQIYIQGQFRPGMTWENYGPVWHLDHVRPLASFDLLDHEQQKLACYWENFQPLFAEENLKKGAIWQN